MKQGTFKNPMKKSVKHLFKVDEKGNPLTFERQAVVKFPVCESIQDVMEHSLNSEAFVVGAYNSWLRIMAQRSANNDLLGMSGGNPELKSLLKTFRSYLDTQRAILADDGEADVAAELAKIAANLLKKKTFAPLAGVVDASSAAASVELDYTGTESVKRGETVVLLPCLRPKLAAVDGGDEEEEETEAESETPENAANKAK